MNYHIIFCGLLGTTFDTVFKLILESAREADYLVKTYAMPVKSAYSSLIIDAMFQGSAKKEPLEIVVDFDCVYNGEPRELHLHPLTLDIPFEDSMIHYWGVAGSLCKVIPDLSTAYITSYLLENDMSKELSLFKKHTLTSLPFKMQDYLAKIG